MSSSLGFAHHQRRDQQSIGRRWNQPPSHGVHHATRDYATAISDDDKDTRDDEVVVFHMTERAKLSNAKQLKKMSRKKKKGWFRWHSSKGGESKPPGSGRRGEGSSSTDAGVLYPTGSKKQEDKDKKKNKDKKRWFPF